MHRVLIFVALLMVMSEASGSSKQTLREYGENLRESLARELKSEDFSPDKCRVGFSYFMDDGRVYALGQEAYVLGLRKNDTVLKFDEVAIDANDPEFFEKLPDWRKGDEVKIVIKRDGKELEIIGQCPHSWQDSFDSWGKLIPPLLKDKPDKCLSTLNELERDYGKTQATYRARNSCYFRYLDKSRWKKGTKSDYATLVLSQYLFAIEAASHTEGNLEDLKPEILRVQAYLENSNQHRFSRELGRSYEEALAPKRQPTESDDGFAGATSYGTCFAVSDDGLVLTSEHVVTSARQITVRFDGEESYSAIVDSASSSTDLALLRTERSTEEYLGLAPMRSAQPGDDVFTYGYPVSHVLGNEPKFTDGTISALSGPGGEATFLQISVPIQPGNSGGPLVNEQGQLVGVVAATAAIEPFIRNTGALPQNVNWAVKADYVRLMFEPVERRPAGGRQEAIKRVRAAICAVEAEH